jgi:UDP-N-acetylmuramoyl-L-alanyl-D-glutamate--2,6-diaminopimelate ligase
MLFSSLIAAAGVSAQLAGDGPVDRVVADSRRVRKGDCFVAVPGTSADGHKFIPAALSAGAAAVVCQDASALPKGTPRALVGDCRRALGPLAQAFLGWPSRKLTVTGVTGTNGKTTFTFLVRQILQAAGRKAALFGTIQYDSLQSAVQASNTTPGALELAEMMAGVVAAGGTDLVMEVSSHALDQDRVAGVEFAAAAFTNLTGDHLDYHGTMDNYLAAKCRLFQGLSARACAVLNRDDPSSAACAKVTQARVIWYGTNGEADLSAQVLAMNSSGTTFRLVWQGQGREIHSRLIGRHNVSNCLAAAGAALGLGLPPETVAAALEQVAGVPGRLQRVESARPFQVLVDYAHTDDALANVLSALRPLTRGQLTVVFGCGGNRDRTKRPRMAGVAQQWADRILVTSDNPRLEEPGAIIQDILGGFSPAGRQKVQVEPDRRKAIAAAIAAGGPGDVVLLAGKGHENYQIIGHDKTHFDDVEVARECLRQ